MPSSRPMLTVPIRNPSPRPGHSDRDRLSPTLSPTSTLFSDKGGRSSPSPNHPASLIPPKVYLTLRSRQILLGFVSLFSLVCVLALYNPKYSPTFSSLRPLFSSDTIDGTTAQSLQLLSQLYEDERISLLSSYDQDASEALVRTAPDALNPDFNAYIERLERFTNTYFKNSKYQDALTDSLQRMVDGHSPVVEQDMSKNIFTFDKDGRAGVPDEFQWWESRLGPQGWKIEVGDDDQMEAWFQESIGGIGDRIELSDEGEGNGKRAWEEMWHGLGRPVLKSDLLRYLMMLVKGGLYTDSDTSVLSDPDLWGIHASDLTPRGLAALQRAMRHLESPHDIEHIPPPSADRPDLDLASSPIKDTSRGINNRRVSLVVAVEYDVSHPRQDPRFGYTRDLQIVQWTFMAKPFHPVFLDVLETATTDIMHQREQGQHHDSWQNILDTTGPGPFTDAVLRYLLVQYGVAPNELIGMENGALIGDVLVLPLHAFGSYLGGEQDWNAHDPSTRCTAHGFRGRWKGGISFDRRSRIHRK